MTEKVFFNFVISAGIPQCLINVNQSKRQIGERTQCHLIDRTKKLAKKKKKVQPVCDFCFTAYKEETEAGEHCRICRRMIVDKSHDTSSTGTVPSAGLLVKNKCESEKNNIMKVKTEEKTLNIENSLENGPVLKQGLKNLPNITNLPESLSSNMKTAMDSMAEGTAGKRKKKKKEQNAGLVIVPSKKAKVDGEAVKAGEDQKTAYKDRLKLLLNKGGGGGEKKSQSSGLQNFLKLL